MFEISAFANIKRRPMTKWTSLLTKSVGEVPNVPLGTVSTTKMVYELISGVKPDGSETYMVRITKVTGAGGYDAGTSTFADKFDALDHYNEVAGNIVSVGG